MIEKLVELLPDKVKGASTPPRKLITSVSIEYIPTLSLMQFIDIKSPLIATHLCLLVCTAYSLEIWLLVSYKKFQRVYLKRETGLEEAHYIPGNEENPIVAVAKSEKDSDCLKIHLLALKTGKYTREFTLKGILDNFIVNREVLAATLKGGKIAVIDLKRWEEREVIETIFLSKEIRDILMGEDADLEVQRSVASTIERIEAKCTMTETLMAYVKYDIVSEGKLTKFAKEVLQHKLVNEYTFAKETASTLFSLGDAGYKKLVNILNMRKATMRSQDSYEDFAPFAAVRKNSEELEDFVDLVDEAPGKEGVSEEADNKVTVVVRNVKNVKNDVVICRFSPRYFNGVTVIKFSPSGTLLLLGNENAQQFYIYKLFPETHCRHLSSSLSSGKAAVLLYTIFRGYTSATISNVEFSLNERWVIISSAKGTSHIYRLDENAGSSHNPIIANHSDYDYAKLSASQQVTKLSAFGRFRHDHARVKGELWPVAAVLARYPVDRIEGNGKVGSEQHVPLFFSVTRYGEVFTNALVILKSEEKDVEFDFQGQKDYEMLRRGNKNLTRRENYYNDKLVIKTLAQFELDVVSKILPNNIFTKKTYISKKAKEESEEAIKTLVPTKEEYRLSQKDWLKEIMPAHFSAATPSIYISPQFRFCKWDSAPSEPSAEDCDTLLCREEKYDLIEKSPKSKIDLTALMQESYLGKREEELGDVYEEPDNKNPFCDLDDDREFEERLSKALTTSMKPEEPEQKSQIFQDEINVMDDYTNFKCYTC
eukprot:TRINITY_DN12852_c0_g3_i4.p1 TRINITY_DN12852_c0_g3~~TRINITY_DN12852_c0_g3_i4.p1  ORF type:complete len:765 (-),score=185.91 TRINITY_DN12852_c0_g3_i4:118-2412(-)